MPPDSGKSPILSCREWTPAWLKSKGFEDVDRVSAKDLPHEDICRLVAEAERTGLPLVLTDWHQREEWNANILNMDWLLDNMSEGKVSVEIGRARAKPHSAKPIPSEIDARNVVTREDVRMPFRRFVDTCRAASPYATLQGPLSAPSSCSPLTHSIRLEKGRLYAKDLSCPEQWERWLQNLPSALLPGGSNDLITNLPTEDRPENLMCYIGTGDTYTPLHKDLCGSIGQVKAFTNCPIKVLTEFLQKESHVLVRKRRKCLLVHDRDGLCGRC